MMLALLRCYTSIFDGFIIIIIKQAGQPVGGARVRVAERAKDLVASSRGEFWRLLTPGEPT